MSSEKYAGFWLRFVAYIIDYIVIYILQTLIVIPFLGMVGLGIVASNSLDFDYMSEQEIFGMIAGLIAAVGTLIMIATAIQILYYTIMESSKYQATLGKMAVGLYVTDLEGNPLDFGRAFLRNIGKIISGTLLMIGYIMAGLTDKKQALHDMIASTLVLKK